MDLVFATLLLVPLAFFVVALKIINPWTNPGPLFFVQTRMGRGCKPFRAIKFRTMRPANDITRSPEDPIEAHRITPLGRILRRSRIDELPQILNVLTGEMSLIGPRPDFYDHASFFLQTIPNYRHRHLVRPGISGLAQVDFGYAEGSAATNMKVRLDLTYIREAGFGLDTSIMLKTIRTVLRGDGA